MDIKRQERAPIYEALEEFKKKRVSRIIDAVEAGGGFLPEAEEACCNLRISNDLLYIVDVL